MKTSTRAKKNTKTHRTKIITAAEFDKKFDNAEDVSDYLDFASAEKVNVDIQRINLDLPKWMLLALNKEAERLGIPRQAVIKTMLDSVLSKKSA